MSARYIPQQTEIDYNYLNYLCMYVCMYKLPFKIWDFFKNNCIQQGCIKYINSGSKDVYNVTKGFYNSIFQMKAALVNFLFFKES